MRTPSEIAVVGGGLAGSEAAWQLAERGHRVALYEMRPARTTPAHKTDQLAELVCSNTFKSTEATTAHGLLKAETRELGSMILAAADEARVLGGTAHTVDRALFAAGVHARLHANCPMERAEYEAFLDALVAADQAAHASDEVPYFEGCMPVEEMARCGRAPTLPPPTTMLGAPYRHLREADPRHFQPMNANFGLVDDLPVPVRDKLAKRERLARRALADFRRWRGAALGGAPGAALGTPAWAAA